MDDLKFEFLDLVDQGSGCEIKVSRFCHYPLQHLKKNISQAYSRARQASGVEDFGRNYCNLYNLMVGTGLLHHKSGGGPNNIGCPQFSNADCDIY